MEHNHRIKNVKNTVGRRSILILVSPLVLLTCIVYLIISLFTSTWIGLRTAARELQYDYYKLKRLVLPGVLQSWLGNEAYDARVKAEEDRKAKMMFNRA